MPRSTSRPVPTGRSFILAMGSPSGKGASLCTHFEKVFWIVNEVINPFSYRQFPFIMLCFDLFITSAFFYFIEFGLELK